MVFPQVAALPCMADDTVFAVHAPHGTSLEVPDPGQGPKHYRRASPFAMLHVLTASTGSPNNGMSVVFPPVAYLDHCW